MSNSAFTYAVLAGVSMATYIIAARLGSSGTHPALGTAIITGVAFLINVAITLVVRATGVQGPSPSAHPTISGCLSQ